MSALKLFQVALQPNTLYEVWGVPSQSISGKGQSLASQLRPTIEIVGSAADVFGSQYAPAEAPTGMSLIFDNAQGFKVLDFIPNYLYIDGSPTSVVVSGIGAIARTQMQSKNEIEVFSSAGLVSA